MFNTLFSKEFSKFCTLIKTLGYHKRHFEHQSATEIWACSVCLASTFCLNGMLCYWRGQHSMFFVGLFTYSHCCVLITLAVSESYYFNFLVFIQQIFKVYSHCNKIILMFLVHIQGGFNISLHYLVIV